MNEGEKVAKMGWGKIEGAKCVGGQKKPGGSQGAWLSY